MSIAFMEAPKLDDYDPEEKDTVPPTDAVEFPCEVCGKESGPYSGRGRKPKRCDEHKRGKSTRQVGRVTGTNASLAAQATETLAQLNGLVAVGLTVAKMFGTAGAIAAYDERFREQAYAALVTDPDLCRMLLRTGLKSAKASLALAYVGMGIAVTPVAVEEIKSLKAERAAAREESDSNG